MENGRQYCSLMTVIAVSRGRFSEADEVNRMKREIVESEQLLEAQRLQNMAWWETSDWYMEELDASREVREDYQEMLKELSPELCAILDRIEEEWYLMKEAELQATYMQGISDGMDMHEEQLRRVS